MKPKPGGVRSRLAHSTALLAVCLLIGSRLASLSRFRPAGEPPGAPAFAAAAQDRVTLLAGRLGNDEEHWSVPQPDVLAEQVAQLRPGGLADVPAEQRQPGAAQHHGADQMDRDVDEYEQQFEGAAAQQGVALPSAGEAPQQDEQPAHTAAAAQAEGDVQQQDQVQQQQQAAEPEQPGEQQQPEQQPPEQQATGPAAGAQAHQEQQPANLQQQDEGTDGTVQAQQQAQQAQPPPQRQQQQQQQQAQQQQQPRQQQAQQQVQPQLRCAVINNVSTHLDVAAGLAWALQEAGCSVTCYLHHATQGIQDVMSQWYRGRYSPMAAILQDAPQYDILVVATMSLPPAPASLGLREIMLGQPQLPPPPPHQRVALVVHNPDHLLVGLPLWLPGMLLSQAVQLGAGQPTAGAAGMAGQAQRAAAKMQQRKARAGASGRRLEAAAGKTGPPLPPRLQLLALSPNVAAYTSSLVETWAGSILGAATQPRVPVPWLPPLVPWQSTAAEHAATAAGQAAAAADALSALVGPGAGGPNRPMRHLCIQGAIDPRRRDYDSFFEAASHPAVLAQLKARGERLLLVGHKPRHGLPPMPKHLNGFVEVAADLMFELYYNTLTSCRAILTAFGSDGYVINKTSSTIAAAIHLEVPLLTEERVLDAYPFLDRTAAFVYDSGLRAPNVAKLARSAARQGTPAMLAHAIRMSIAGEGAGRRLQEDAAETAAAAAAEDAFAAEAGGSGGGQQGSSDSSSSSQQQQQQPGGPAAGAAATAGTAPAAARIEQPQAGSYAAALLTAFDDDAVRAARQAARELKAQLMRHNLEAAGALLSETAAAAAALAG